MLFRVLLATAMVVPMFADDRDWRRDRRDDRRNDRWEDRRRDNDRYRYGNNGPYGYGNGSYGNGNGNYGYGQSNGVINRALQNLQVAASRNRVDSHERGHFNRAISELQNMRYDRGQIDSRRLNRVLEDLRDLSRADQIHPRDRQMLARDYQALASLNGYGYNRW